jgi:hypothetical protein
MVAPIRPRDSGVSELMPTQQTGQTQGVKQTTGTQQTDGLAGIGFEMKQDGQSQSIPQNDQPRVSKEQIEQSIKNINQLLSSGKDIDAGELTKQIEILMHSVDQQQLKTQQTGIKGTQDQIQRTVDEQVKKLGEAKEKMEAEKTWNTVKDIFTYAAMAVSVIAAVATGGILAVAVAGLGVALTIAQKTGALDKAFDALGITDPNWRTAITIGLSLALIAGSITNTTLIAKGVGEAATRALLPRAFEALGVIGKGTEALKNVSTGIKIVGQVVGGTLKIGEGTNQIGSTVARNERDNLNIEVKELQTKNVALKKQQDDLMDQLREILKKLDEGVQTTTQTLQTQSQTTQRLIQQMS